MHLWNTMNIILLLTLPCTAHFRLNSGKLCMMSSRHWFKILTAGTMFCALLIWMSYQLLGRSKSSATLTVVWRNSRHNFVQEETDRKKGLILLSNGWECADMVQAWVAHFVTPLKLRVGCVRLTSHESKPHKKHKSPTKHHHHGGGATHPSSGMDLMNPCRLRGGRHCTCLFLCRHWSD